MKNGQMSSTSRRQDKQQISNVTEGIKFRNRHKGKVFHMLHDLVQHLINLLLANVSHTFLYREEQC